MDVGLVGAGVLSGILGAHLVTTLRDRLSAGTWMDSIVGALGGAVCGQVAVLASVAWDATTAGLAVGRIALVVLAAILGGAGLLTLVGLVWSRKHEEEEREVPRQERRAAHSDRRKGERRMEPRD